MSEKPYLLICPECNGRGMSVTAECWRCDGAGMLAHGLLQVLRDVELLLDANATNEIRVIGARSRVRMVLRTQEAAQWGRRPA